MTKEDIFCLYAPDYSEEKNLLISQSISNMDEKQILKLCEIIGEESIFSFPYLKPEILNNGWYIYKEKTTDSIIHCSISVKFQYQESVWDDNMIDSDTIWREESKNYSILFFKKPPFFVKLNTKNIEL